MRSRSIPSCCASKTWSPASTITPPRENVLDAVGPGPGHDDVVAAALPVERQMVSGAATMICLVGRFRRHERKYGEGGYRMMVAEAGHISQNLVLAATALGLAARPFGGVFDGLMNRALRLDEAEEQFLLAVLVGHAERGDKLKRPGAQIMRMEYENGVLRVENAQGRRWQLNNVAKPRLNFEYDALFVSQERALRRVGANVQPLTEQELEEVAAFIGKQEPPASAPLQRQLTADLKVFSYGLINAVVTQLEYDNLLDVQITGREDSTDLYADEARRVLAYVDAVWNAFYGLAAQIKATPEADLKTPAGLRQHDADGALRPSTSSTARARRACARSKPAEEAPVAQWGRRAAPVDRGDEHLSVERRERPRRTRRISPRSSTACSSSMTSSRARSSHILEQWALKTPHWMLTNSTYNEKGEAMHRIWGASYIEPWRRNGWTGLPPVLYAAIATLFRKLNVTITVPEYIGLNGQSRGQDASMHADCELDSPDDLSILVYLGEDTSGDLCALRQERSHAPVAPHPVPAQPRRRLRRLDPAPGVCADRRQVPHVGDHSRQVRLRLPSRCGPGRSETAPGPQRSQRDVTDVGREHEPHVPTSPETARSRTSSPRRSSGTCSRTARGSTPICAT